MVPASMLLRMRRELETVYWILALMLAQQQRPERAQRVEGPKPKPRQRNTFDWRKRQAGDRDDA